jgi:hypothetical protein
MSYKVIPTPQFEKEVKKLSKKYPSVKGCYFDLTMPVILVKRYQIVGFPMLFKTTKTIKPLRTRRARRKWKKNLCDLCGEKKINY